MLSTEAITISKKNKCFTSYWLLSLQAISNPRDENLQQTAWEGVCPLVVQLKKYYEFSLLLGKKLSVQYFYSCFILINYLYIDLQVEFNTRVSASGLCATADTNSINESLLCYL